ncbi:hypothetical protein T02_13191 [Trichinella nativa]|uniref:Uncharacterized protein n=2 Tax=Trichinella TaxID=6333 RepID=A0A0V1L706_9BILA|nr:hypothetical protein T06_14576 [Trichinella sp. T6]KRY15074.1 hypothetical protein T12_16766 [Trichinella patagoniensis]KRZ55321.1 hypothetical protein T02_13191 [Trichinella nativa]KRZ97111.1 hypothetical protein T08_16186 [Trichinella sp. T8]
MLLPRLKTNNQAMIINVPVSKDGCTVGCWTHGRGYSAYIINVRRYQKQLILTAADLAVVISTDVCKKLLILL